MPTPNPDSDFEKEKELVLKERARRLVQIESQEESEALRPKRSDLDLERTATCDARRDEDCPRQSPANRRQKTRSRDELTTPEANPQTVPEQLPSQNRSRILQADGLPEVLDQLDGAGLPQNLELTPSSLKRETNPLGNSQSLGQGALDGLPTGEYSPSTPLARSGGTEVLTDKNRIEQPSRPRTARARTNENAEEFTAGTIVHPANPPPATPPLYITYGHT